jgi:nitrogen PTS system EIIA component
MSGLSEIAEQPRTQVIVVKSYADIFFDVGVQTAIFSDLDAPDKSSALRPCVRIIGEFKGLSRDDIETISNAVLRREHLGSTGLGQGLAVPHTRHPPLSKPIVGWFVMSRPLDYDALDGEPVSLIVCYIVPSGNPFHHLILLEGTSRPLKGHDLVSIARNGAAGLREFLYAENERWKAEDEKFELARAISDVPGE